MLLIRVQPIIDILPAPLYTCMWKMRLFAITIKPNYNLIMPVTKTAKRALRVSARKLTVNETLKKRIEIAQKTAKKSPTLKNVSVVFSLTDRAKKNKIIHANKAAHIKSAFSKLLSSKA